MSAPPPRAMTMSEASSRWRSRRSRAEGKVAINRILLDGRAIAATITLKSGDGAWYWKTAYDETLARFAPGVLLSAALTEDLAENAAIARTDSCAGPGNPILDQLWRERLGLCDRLIAVRPECAALDCVARWNSCAAQQSLRQSRLRQRLRTSLTFAACFPRISLRFTGNAEGSARTMAKPIEIRMGGYGPPTTSFSRSLKLIGEELQAQFGDRIDVKYVWNIMDFGYRAEEILWLVEDGVLSLGYQSSSYLTDRVPELGFVDLPFLFGEARSGARGDRRRARQISRRAHRARG